jgi:hypothetical protein
VRIKTAQNQGWLRTTPRRMVVPYLILRSAADVHSSLKASVMSALLSFVLSMGVCGSLERMVIGDL